MKPQRAEKGIIFLANGANGMSDIEGKVAREAMSECGQRASFKPFGIETQFRFSYMPRERYVFLESNRFAAGIPIKRRIV